MPFVSSQRRGLLIGSAGLLILLAGSPTDWAEEKPQAKATDPWGLEALRKPPKVTVAEEGKTLTALYYEGEPCKEKPTRVFAYLARPEKVEGKLPAMVLVHGGGGTAFKEWAELWAKR